LRVGAGRRALLAEDDPISAAIAEKALTRLGFEVVRAADGDEALQRAAAAQGASPFDLVLMDIHLPGLDGLEATRRLRAMEERTGAPPTPVVALTAGLRENERCAAHTAGFDAKLGKPIDLAELEGAIKAVWEKRERLGQVVSQAS